MCTCVLRYYTLVYSIYVYIYSNREYTYDVYDRHMHMSRFNLPTSAQDVVVIGRVSKMSSEKQPLMGQPSAPPPYGYAQPRK